MSQQIEVEMLNNEKQLLTYCKKMAPVNIKWINVKSQNVTIWVEHLFESGVKMLRTTSK